LGLPFEYAAAQVDETRAQVFLKEKRDAEAEKSAGASERVLENSDMQSVLIEALTTHATALARLGNYSSAFATFRRSLDLSLQIGDRNRTAEVAVTLLAELGDRLAIVERPMSGRKLREQVLSLEHDLIKRALEESEGSVTYAARALGMPSGVDLYAEDTAQRLTKGTAASAEASTETVKL
jgi:hypothetical protein